MTSATQTLTEEMEKLSSRIMDDLTSTIVNLSGSLKDIECGTHIRIPMGAGYVNYYKSQEAESITFWLKEAIVSTYRKENQTNLNYDEED